MNTLIKIKNLSVGFHSQGHLNNVVHSISFNIPRGKTVAIVGESGSGKSQFVKTLSGLNEDYYELTQGSIEYILNDTESFSITSNSGSNDINYSSIKEYFLKNNIYGRNIGMMFQNPSTCFNPFWTVGQHFDAIEQIVMHTGEYQELISFKKQILHTK